GLEVPRPRLFESSVLLMSPPKGRRRRATAGIYGHMDGRKLWTRADGSELRACSSLEEARRLMGMPWADWDGIREAVPPAYTEWIGRQLIEHLSGGGES